MIETNIKFQEEYKRLDKLCKDRFASSEGVSTYIREMENMSDYTYTISKWTTTYRQLKHLRWIRNQLAHEVPINSDICEPGDIEWLQRFYSEMLQGRDCLSLAYKANNCKQASSKTTYVATNTLTKNTDNSAQNIKPQHKQTWWEKIVSKIKSWLS